MTTEDETLTRLSGDEALRLFNKISFGHLGGIDHVWGPFGSRGRGLIWTETGRMRLAHTIGWITTLSTHSQHEQQTAEALAEYFAAKLDFLAAYGGHTETTAGKTPNFLVELADDGTFAGFSLLWFSRTGEASGDIEAGRLRTYGYGIDKQTYVFTMNGGLLFHGLDRGDGGPPTFAVRLGSDTNPWSIHT